MTKLQELRAKFNEKSKKLSEVFKEGGTDKDFSKVKCLGSEVKTQKEVVEKIEQMSKELDDLNDELQAEVKLENIESQNKKRQELFNTGVRLPMPEESKARTNYDMPTKTLGEQFVESQAYKNRGQMVESVIAEDMNLKTLFETTAGWAPETTRTGRLVLDAQRPVQVRVANIIPEGQTSQSSVVYMEETTFTNAAAEVAEGGSYAESTLVYAERSSTVRKIGVSIPVTDEQLEDEARISSLIDNRLRFMLEQRLDLQILVGDGIAPNLEGINNVTNVQTQAKGADPVPDALYKGITRVNVTGQANASAIVMHPNDWQSIRLLRTSNDIYIFGSPNDTGIERIWGLPVIQAQAQTENTALIGDYQTHSELVNRRGIEVQISNSHSDFFIKGKKMIRADMRVALPIYRPEAFCTVTGI